ncbi:MULTISPECIES: hypothetical protein [Lactobacillus]|uniref:DUF2479 domain-containing protein n=1 Tax=Lactobacillus xujianguonis TaxID=2495899 RepID=A0A437SXY0_9LACO|nr:MULTISPECIES: hypothetical protein [Lactobacillus]RVU71775.1 hypothetical protein EJK17_00415 [Lactobacillus xujianguonis]
MSLAPITLTTDKSTAVIDNAHRKLRQDENGLSITVTVLNADNSAYNLTGKNLVFCENKNGNKIIIDNGQGDNSGKFTRSSDNDSKGIFTYCLQPDIYTASGKAWFEITDGTTVDSTKNFYFDVEKDAQISVTNNDYVGSLKALETAMAGVQTKLTSDLNDMQAQLTEQITNTKAANQQAITNALKDLTDKTTAALSNVEGYTNTINQKYNDDFSKLRTNFESWETSTIDSYQKQVNGILAQVQQNGTDVTNIQKQINDAVSKMQQLAKQFSAIDFTRFVKPSDLQNYYTKRETNEKITDDLANYYTQDQVNEKLNDAGKVKTVNNVQPDSNGNISLPAGGVTSFNGQKGDINFKVNHTGYDSPQAAFEASKTGDGVYIYDADDGPTSATLPDNTVITVTSNHDAIVALQDKVNQQDNSSDLQNIKNTIAQMQNNYATKTDLDAATHGVEISEADYNKLPAEQKNKEHIVYIVH